MVSHLSATSSSSNVTLQPVAKNSSSSPLESVKTVFSSICTYFHSSKPIDKHVTHCSIDTTQAPTLTSHVMHEETFSKGVLRKTGDFQLEFSDLTLGSEQVMCFESEKAFDTYLSNKNIFSWEIKDYRSNKIIYKSWNSSNEKFETYSDKNQSIRVILKEAGGAFKLLDKSSGKTTYILDQSGYFRTGYDELASEEQFLEAFKRKVDRHSLMITSFKWIAAVAALGAIKYAAHWMKTATGETELAEPFFENALTTTLAATSTHVGRRLLSTTVQSLLPTLVATEETPFSTQQYVWDIFRTTDGSHISVSAKQTNGQPLPLGISVINQPMNILSTTYFQAYTVQAIAYKNNYAFVAMDAGLRVFDVSNPQSPVMVSYIFFNTMNGLDIVDNLCYGIGGVTGFVVIDINDPLNPVIISQLVLTGATGIKASGNFSYVTRTSYYNGTSMTYLDVIDLTDPRNPAVAGSLAILKVGASLSSLVLNKNNSRCYTGGPSQGFYSIDVSNPSNPVLLGYINSLGSTNLGVTGIAASNDDNIFFVGTSISGVQIIDVSNSSHPITTGAFSSGPVNFVKIAGNFLFTSFQSTVIQKYDVSNIRNPLLVSSVPFQAKDLVISPTNCLFISISGLSPALGVSTLGDTFSLAGTPAPGTQGNYSIDLTGTSSNGSATEPFNLEIKPAITLTGTIPPQKAIVGSNFNYFVQVFSQVNNTALIYTAKLINGSLPSWLNLNSISGTFSGTPTSTDTGMLNLQLTATDLAGASTLTTFQITVLNGPILNSLIPNQVTTIGNPYNFTLNANTFIDRDGYQLTYVATKNGGALPQWLTFDPGTQTFSGVPSLSDGGVVTISLAAQGSLNTTISTDFQINVVLEPPPAILNPISSQSANVGERFEFVVPDTTFSDPYAPRLTYSAALNDGSPLPSWLSFNSSTRTFSGTPGYGDTDAISARDLQIVLTAKGIQTTQTTTFSINISGTSYAKIALAVIGPIVSVATTLFAAYKARGLIWNACKKTTYRKPAQTAFTGQPYQHTISIPRDEIKLVQALFKGKNFPGGAPLPNWLHYDAITKILSSESIPNPQGLTPIKIQVIDYVNRIKEEFDLQIKPHDEAPLLTASPLSSMEIEAPQGKPGKPNSLYRGRHSDAGLT